MMLCGLRCTLNIDKGGKNKKKIQKGQEEICEGVTNENE